MKLLLSIALFVFLALSCKAQGKIECIINERDTIHKGYYIHSTKEASYEDGEVELANMLSRSMNQEGATAEDFIFGQRIILFIYIDENGDVKDVHGFGKNKHDFFEKQVIAILSKIRWIPGECDGVKVPTRKDYFVRFGFRRFNRK